MSLTLALFLLCCGLLLLIWSADRLVYGAAGLARNYGLSPLLIGMTILAMGSSAPEMVVSAVAALDGKTDTAIGNVIGSNIANIALILGIVALIRPININLKLFSRDLPLLLGSSVLVGILFYNGLLDRIDGMILITLFILFIVLMVRNRQENGTISEADLSDIPKNIKNSHAIFWIIVGLVVLPLAANLLVSSAVVIAKAFGMSDLLIGLTIIAIGTSLPELAASVVSVLKNEGDMAIGNIIGSNIFNILAVLGIPAIIRPGVIDPLIWDRDYPIMMGLTLLFTLFCFFGAKRLNRIEASILLAIFISYMYHLIISA